MADGWGGRRPGAGRKPKLTTVIRELSIDQANGDAQYALGLLASFMRDEKLDPRLRRECANDVMERVWGKATQTNRNENSGEMVIRVIYDDAETDPPSPSSCGADAIQG